MFCRNCGAELEPEDKFCADCGTRVKARPAAKSSESTSSPFTSQAGTAEVAVPPTVRTLQSTAEVFARPVAVPAASKPAPLSVPDTPPREIPRAVERAAPAIAPPPAPAITPPVQATAPERQPSFEEQDTVEAPPPSWLTQVGPARPAAAPPAPAAEESPAAEVPLYTYDPTAGQSSHRGLLIAVLLLLVFGIVGIFFLMRSSPRSSSSAAPLATASNISITIDPTSAELNPGNTLDVTATITNGEGTEVGWVVKEGLEGGHVVTRGAEALADGKVALMAVYVAPNDPGTYHLVVTSKADPSKSAEAVIKVVPKK